MTRCRASYKVTGADSLEVRSPEPVTSLRLGLSRLCEPIDCHRKSWYIFCHTKSHFWEWTQSEIINNYTTGKSAMTKALGFPNFVTRMMLDCNPQWIWICGAKQGCQDSAFTTHNNVPFGCLPVVSIRLQFITFCAILLKSIPAMLCTPFTSFLSFHLMSYSRDSPGVLLKAILSAPGFDFVENIPYSEIRSPCLILFLMLEFNRYSVGLFAEKSSVKRRSMSLHHRTKSGQEMQ